MLRKLLCFFACACRLLASDTAPPNNPEAVRFFQQACEMADEGAFFYAIDNLNRAIAIEKHPDFYFELGKAYHEVGRDTLAFYALQRSIDLDPDNPFAAGLLFDISLSLDKLKQAEKLLSYFRTFDSSLALQSEVKLLCARGEKAFKKGLFGKAYSFFRKARIVGADDVTAVDGCRRSLGELASKFESAAKYDKLLLVCLRLYRILPSRYLAGRIRAAFEKAGRPASLEEEVMSVIRHARRIQDQH